MKKLYSLDIRGKRKEWCFDIWADPKYVEEWRNDGLVLQEILNTVPMWVADFKLTRIWC